MTDRGALVTAAATLAVAGAVLGITLWTTAQRSAAHGITISAPPP